MVIKTAETIKPGDIFLTEYGDFDNWCKFEFISCEPHDNFTKINVRSVNYGNTFDIYDLNPIDKVRFEVIGNENTDNS
jgi:hypothetical protein